MTKWIIQHLSKKYKKVTFYFYPFWTTIWISGGENARIPYTFYQNAHSLYTYWCWTTICSCQSNKWHCIRRRYIVRSLFSRRYNIITISVEQNEENVFSKPFYIAWYWVIGTVLSKQKIYPVLNIRGLFSMYPSERDQCICSEHSFA